MIKYRAIFYFLVVVSIGIPSFLYANTPLSNTREGESFFLKKSSYLSQLSDLKDFIGESRLNEFSKDYFSHITPKLFCSDTFVEDFEHKIKEKFGIIEYDFGYEDNEYDMNKNKSYNGFYLYLRSLNYIDDVVLDLLLKRSNSTRTPSLPPFSSSYNNIVDQKGVLRFYRQLKSSYSKGSCIDDDYQNLVANIKKVGNKISSKILRWTNYLALKKGIIDKDLWIKMEIIRQNNLYNSKLTIKKYLAKKKFLSKQFPITHIGKADFATSEISKGNSVRMNLYKNYNQFQIVTMANTIKLFKKRIEAVSAGITITYFDGETEKIDLAPMEQFRLMVRLMKKEMTLLQNNSLFSGKAPQYKDLIAAAFEVDMITPAEISDVAAIELLWNPLKTRKEKILYWVQNYGFLFTILVPQPYGFAATLALVAIEATSKKEDESEREHSLF